MGQVEGKGAIPNNAAAVQAPEKTKKESKDKAKEKDTLADFGRFEELPVSVRQLVAQHATPLSASMLCFTSRANYKLFAAFELSTEKMLVECAKEGQLKLFKHIQRQFDFAWPASSGMDQGQWVNVLWAAEESKHTKFAGWVSNYLQETQGFSKAALLDQKRGLEKVRANFRALRSRAGSVSNSALSSSSSSSSNYPHPLDGLNGSINDTYIIERYLSPLRPKSDQIDYEGLLAHPEVAGKRRFPLSEWLECRYNKESLPIFWENGVVDSDYNPSDAPTAKPCHPDIYAFLLKKGVAIEPKDYLESALKHDHTVHFLAAAQLAGLIDQQEEFLAILRRMAWGTLKATVQSQTIKNCDKDKLGKLIAKALKEDSISSAHIILRWCLFHGLYPEWDIALAFAKHPFPPQNEGMLRQMRGTLRMILRFSEQLQITEKRQAKIVKAVQHNKRLMESVQDLVAIIEEANANVWNHLNINFDD